MGRYKPASVKLKTEKYDSFANFHSITPRDKLHKITFLIIN